MKLVFGFVCALFYSFMSFGQITQWTDINYANDSLEDINSIFICPMEDRLNIKWWS